MPCPHRLLLAAACLALQTTAWATEPLTNCASPEAERAWIEQLNALRDAGAACAPAAATRKPLAWESRLAATSHALAADLAQRDEVSHLDNKGRALDVRLRSNGYLMIEAAENVAAGHETFASTLRAWAASPDHCTNLMFDAFTDVGIACVERRDSTYVRFWVAQFGASRR